MRSGALGRSDTVSRHCPAPCVPEGSSRCRALLPKAVSLLDLLRRRHNGAKKGLSECRINVNGRGVERGSGVSLRPAKRKQLRASTKSSRRSASKQSAEIHAESTTLADSSEGPTLPGVTTDAKARGASSGKTKRAAPGKKAIPPLPDAFPQQIKARFPHVTLINGNAYAPVQGWICSHPGCWEWFPSTDPQKVKTSHRNTTRITHLSARRNVSGLMQHF